jgi:hypothetical protein
MRINELEIYAELQLLKGKPHLILIRRIYNEKNVNDLLNLIMREEYIPTRIIARDKFKFMAKLKNFNLLKRVKKGE